MDTTRADHLGCYGYGAAKTPEIDMLAKEGVRFESCIAPAVLTLPAHASIFTGLYPNHHGLRVNGIGALSKEQLTLAEVFKDQGYACAAFVASFVLDARWGLNQGFDSYDDRIDMELGGEKFFDMGRVQRPGNQVVDSAISWLDKNKQDPFFIWLHLYDPHTPYEPPAEFAQLFPDNTLGLYDGEIAFTDHQLGRLLKALAKKKLLEQTLIVVVGDHGESLGEHGEQTHGFFVYQGAIHVPFIIKFPSGHYQDQIIRQAVSSIDMMPTILDYLLIPMPDVIHGRSLLPMLNGKQFDRPVYAESLTPNIQYGWSPLHAIVTNGMKYIDAPKAELFDLGSDPREKANLYGRKAVQAGQFKSSLDKMMSSAAQGSIAPETADLDQATLNKLASLGYASLNPTRGESEGKTRKLSDPKDKLLEYKNISLAAEQISLQKFSQAVTLLEEVLKKDPDIPQARLLLASAFLNQNENQLARVQLDILLKADPNNTQALIALAGILKSQGQEEEMVAICKKAISLDESNTQAYSLIGDLYISKKEYDSALPYFQKAIQIQPKLTQNQLNLAVCQIGLEQFSQARTVLENIILEKPEFPLAHFNLGFIHHQEGNLQLAKKSYNQEIELHPQEIPPRFNLAEILFLEKDVIGYRKQMEAIIATAPDLPRGYLFLARAILAGDPNEYLRGIELAKQGLSKAKDQDLQKLAYYLLADFYSRLDQKDKTLEMVKKARQKSAIPKKGG